MYFPPIPVNKSANMKSVKTVSVFCLVSVFLFTISQSSVSGGDPDMISPNYRSQQYKIYIDKTKQWIQSHGFKSATQASAKKYRVNHDIKQHAKNNPYFVDPNYTLDVPKRGDPALKLRIKRSIKKKADEKLYQDQINAEEQYDLKQRENIEAIFQSLAYETEKPNIYDGEDVKANMEAVFGVPTSELKQNNKNNRLNTANKGFIVNSTIMARIADIFGPPPGFNMLHFKRNTDEKNYQGSLQAAIYKNFGPEVLKPSVISDGDSITSPMEDDGDKADNSGLNDRFPPYDAMVIKSGEDHKTRTTTQDSKPAELTPEDSQLISRNRTDLDYPYSSGPGNWSSSSPKTQEVSTPIPTSSSSISTLSPSLLSHDDADNLPPSTSSVANVINSSAPSRNGARTPNANSMIISSCIYCFCLMAALVSRL